MSVQALKDTTNNNAARVESKFPLKDFFSRDVIKSKLNELLGKNTASFITSVLQVARSNDMLSKATPESVFNAALMAATLNLPINNNLGFAYIVPFKNNKKKVVEAQFQIGWKGFVQLAQRSGQFSRITAVPVKKGQLIKANPLTGYEFDWEAEGGETIGYVAYFRLLNGFESMLYMTTPEIEAHAKQFSQSYKQGYGVWFDRFDSMATKTVLKLLLSKYAPLSIDMQKAMDSDQSVINDINGDFSYIDNQPDDVPGEIIDAETGEITSEGLSPEEQAEAVAKEQAEQTN